MIATEVRAVDPDRLLVVRVRPADQHGPETEIVAISCRYLPAVDATGRRAVAAEILFDPGNQQPAAAYPCALDRLRRDILDPRRIENIRPYRAP